MSNPPRRATPMLEIPADQLAAVHGGMLPFSVRVGWQVGTRTTRMGDSSLDALNAQNAARAAQLAAAAQRAAAQAQFQTLRNNNQAIFNPTIQQTLQQNQQNFRDQMASIMANSQQPQVRRGR